VRQVVRAVICVIRNDEGAGLKATFHQLQCLGIERFRSIQQEHVDCFRKIDAQRPQSVSLPELHEVNETSRRQILLGSRNFGRLEFAGDQASAAIVAQGRGEVKG
jgi:hypothetical protein